ncbi:hypothetical protein CPB86DRAFT_790459 [Serendipita vermifera]|nr:hypothetical protein CPB86DRAFT_790459 [Serendipita vermifera]
MEKGDSMDNQPSTSQAIFGDPAKNRVSLVPRVVYKLWKRDNTRCTAANLPNEILLNIFHNIDRLRIDSTLIGNGPRDHMRTLPRVCKNWYGAATKVLYEVVEFPTVHSVFKFHRSLTQRPHLRSLVRVIIFPGRVNKPSPPKFTKTCVQIINMLGEDVEEIHVMCSHLAITTHTGQAHQTVVHHQQHHQTIVPIPMGKCTNIKSLTLFADFRDSVSVPSLDKMGLGNIVSLSLYGFSLKASSGHELGPVLPSLRSLTLVKSGIRSSFLVWLQKQPSLRRLVLRNTVCQLSGVGIVWLITEGRITELDVDVGSTSNDWLLRISSIHDLVIGYRMFSRAIPYPPEVETITLRINSWDYPIQQAFEDFVTKNTSVALRTFKIETCKDQQWVAENKEWLQQTFKEHNITLELVDNKPCKCQSITVQRAATVFHPIVKWFWHRIRYLTPEETVQMIEWEWPAMKPR